MTREEFDFAIEELVHDPMSENNQIFISEYLVRYWEEEKKWLKARIDDTFSKSDFESVNVIVGKKFEGNMQDGNASDKSVLDSHSFDDCILVNCDFSNLKLTNCRFRNTVIFFCDFRYSTISGGTFENATMLLCDFYRSYFCELIRFAGARIRDCSLNNTFFSGGAMIGRYNFDQSKLLQDRASQYQLFLEMWNHYRPANDKIDKAESIDCKIDWRKKDLIFIYKALYAGFVANGFSSDANWAYARACRRERSILWKVIFSRNKYGFFDRIRFFGEWILNAMLDLFFGYGNSLFKLLGTYIAIILVFTWLHYYRGDITGFFQCFIMSIKHMAGMSYTDYNPEQNIIKDMLNLVQTTLGILITGVFGFILGVKMRRQ